MPTNEWPIVAGVELGGTKTIAVLAQGTAILRRRVVATTTPDLTLGAITEQLDSWWAERPFAALGIASFGPLELDPTSSRYGEVLPTPKPYWAGAPVGGTLLDRWPCPAGIDTDVNGAALAEYRWGAGAGANSICYITIGTGVGGGLLIGGTPIHGAMHPEIGHLSLRRLAGDQFSGSCRFHGDCIEGLVSGPALKERFGADPATISDGDAGWDAVVADLAELCATLVLTTSTKRIIIGGGVVSSRAFLLDRIAVGTSARLRSYLPWMTEERARKTIVVPALGTDAGPLGAIALGLMALGARTPLV